MAHFLAHQYSQKSLSIRVTVSMLPTISVKESIIRKYLCDLIIYLIKSNR